MGKLGGPIIRKIRNLEAGSFPVLFTKYSLHTFSILCVYVFVWLCPETHEWKRIPVMVSTFMPLQGDNSGIEYRHTQMREGTQLGENHVWNHTRFYHSQWTRALCMDIPCAWYPAACQLFPGTMCHILKVAPSWTLRPLRHHDCFSSSWPVEYGRSDVMTAKSNFGN